MPLLRNAFPGIDFANTDVPVPKVVAEKLKLDNPSLPLDGLVTLGLGVLCTLIYWAPAAMEQKFLISNGVCTSVLVSTCFFFGFMLGAVVQLFSLTHEFCLIHYSNCMGTWNGVAWCNFAWLIPDGGYFTSWPLLL